MQQRKVTDYFVSKNPSNILMQQRKVTDYFVSKNKRAPFQQEEYIENEDLMNTKKNKKIDENLLQPPIQLNVENEIKKLFLVDPSSIELDLKKLELIKNIFLLLSKNPLPDFYSVNKKVLSMNKMQKDRFRDDSFLYMQTKLRKKLFNQMMNEINTKKNCRLTLTGLQRSGKSHFLADFVLRNRLNNPRLRTLYINDGEQYFGDWNQYIRNEIIYMICLDLDIANFQPKKTFKKEELKGTDDIIEWLLYLENHVSNENLLEFLRNLSTYYREKGIKMLVIWDQINVMGRTIYGDKQDAQRLYQKITSPDEFFDFIFLSASNNNENIKDTENRDVSQILEVNPFEVFNHVEFSQLVKHECDLYNYKPNNVQEIPNDLEELCELLNYSISEFFSYKEAFWVTSSTIPYYKFQNYTWNQIKEKFTSTRKNGIQASEELFQKNINLPVHLEEYYQAMKLLLTFEEMNSLDEETKFSYQFQDKIPIIYNRQLCFYSKDKKMLLCQTNLIKELISCKAMCPDPKYSPWRRELTGTSFQLNVQFHYLNNLPVFNFGDKLSVILSEREKKIRYDCKKCLPDIQNCKKDQTSILFHFTDPTHFAFDSMIYDGNTKSLILIQITQNENHELKFNEINGVIRLKEEKEQTLYQNVHKKYYDFFKEICDRDWVENYYFQWLTSEKFPKLIKRIESELKEIKKLKFQNISFYEPMLEHIMRERTFGNNIKS